MTGFMLDTDISRYIIKRRPATQAEKFEKHGEMLNVSVITAAQLRRAPKVVPNADDIL
jgi:predicted nucleic acid-binding protein